MAGTDRSHLNRRRAALKKERSSFEPQWKDVETYIIPGTTEFSTSEVNRGDKRTSKILNDTGTDAANTLASGMMGGLTNPARPWMLIQTNDAQVNKDKSAKQWCEYVTDTITQVFQESNIYQVLPQFYFDLGGYATGAFLILEDEETILRAYHLPVGSYWIGTSHRGVVDTLLREYKMTAKNMVARFGFENCSLSVQEASRRNEDAWFDVVQLIEPNPERDESKALARFKTFRCVYWEPGTDDKDLAVSGYDTFPAIVARWSVLGNGTYGNMCPGFQCIGDVKALQTGEKRGWEALDKQVRPPLTAPVSLNHTPVSQLPGGITFVDSPQSQAPIRPIFEVNPNFQQLDARMARVEQRIRRAFRADLFLMISQMDFGQPATAAEINARREEKMLMLGPVLQRLNDEAFDPLIKRVFGILSERGLIPPMPESMRGTGLSIEYVSMLAQAQKLVGTAALEKLTAFAGNLIGAFPEVADKFNADEAIDAYAAMVGTRVDVMRDQKEVDAIRGQRQQQQQMQQQMAMAQQGAQTAQTLGDTPMNPDTALGAMLSRYGQAAGA